MSFLLSTIQKPDSVLKSFYFPFKNKSPDLVLVKINFIDVFTVNEYGLKRHSRINLSGAVSDAVRYSPKKRTSKYKHDYLIVVFKNRLVQAIAYNSQSLAFCVAASKQLPITLPRLRHSFTGLMESGDDTQWLYYQESMNSITTVALSSRSKNVFSSALCHSINTDNCVVVDIQSLGETLLVATKTTVYMYWFNSKSKSLVLQNTVPGFANITRTVPLQTFVLVSCVDKIYLLMPPWDSCEVCDLPCKESKAISAFVYVVPQDPSCVQALTLSHRVLTLHTLSFSENELSDWKVLNLDCDYNEANCLLQVNGPYFFLSSPIASSWLFKINDSTPHVQSVQSLNAYSCGPILDVQLSRKRVQNSAGEPIGELVKMFSCSGNLRESQYRAMCKGTEFITVQSFSHMTKDMQFYVTDSNQIFLVDGLKQYRLVYNLENDTDTVFGLNLFTYELEKDLSEIFEGERGYFQSRYWFVLHDNALCRYDYPSLEGAGKLPISTGWSSYHFDSHSCYIIYQDEILKIDLSSLCLTRIFAKSFPKKYASMSIFDVTKNDTNFTYIVVSLWSQQVLVYKFDAAKNTTKRTILNDCDTTLVSIDFYKHDSIFGVSTRGEVVVYNVVNEKLEKLSFPEPIISIANSAFDNSDIVYCFGADESFLFEYKGTDLHLGLHFGYLGLDGRTNSSSDSVWYKEFKFNHDIYLAELKSSGELLFHKRNSGVQIMDEDAHHRAKKQKLSNDNGTDDDIDSQLGSNCSYFTKIVTVSGLIRKIVLLNHDKDTVLVVNDFDANSSFLYSVTNANELKIRDKYALNDQEVLDAILMNYKKPVVSETSKSFDYMENLIGFEDRTSLILQNKLKDKILLVAKLSMSAYLQFIKAKDFDYDAEKSAIVNEFLIMSVDLETKQFRLENTFLNSNGSHFLALENFGYRTFIASGNETGFFRINYRPSKNEFYVTKVFQAKLTKFFSDKINVVNNAIALCDVSYGIFCFKISAIKYLEHSESEAKAASTDIYTVDDYAVGNKYEDFEMPLEILINDLKYVSGGKSFPTTGVVQFNSFLRMYSDIMGNVRVDQSVNRYQDGKLVTDTKQLCAFNLNDSVNDMKCTGPVSNIKMASFYKEIESNSDNSKDTDSPANSVKLSKVHPLALICTSSGGIYSVGYVEKHKDAQSLQKIAKASDDNTNLAVINYRQGVLEESEGIVKVVEQASVRNVLKKLNFGLV